MKRDVPLHIRLSTQEYQVLTSLAQREGVNISEAARQLIHDSCKQAGFSVGMIATPEDENNPNVKMERVRA